MKRNTQPKRKADFLIFKYQILEAKNIIKEIKDAAKQSDNEQRGQLVQLLVKAHNFRAELIEEANKIYPHIKWIHLC